jgi:hypothetical protein
MKQMRVARDCAQSTIFGAKFMNKVDKIEFETDHGIAALAPLRTDVFC